MSNQNEKGDPDVYDDLEPSDGVINEASNIFLWLTKWIEAVAKSIVYIMTTFITAYDIVYLRSFKMGWLVFKAISV